MREYFQRHGKGDQLSAKFVNQMAKVARRTGMGGAGSFTSGIRGTFDATSSLPSTVLHPVVITYANGTDYLCAIRRYNHLTGGWTTDSAAGEHPFDNRDVGGTYAIGDKVLAYWHPKRQAFIPAQGKETTTPGVAADTLVAMFTNPVYFNEADEDVTGSFPAISSTTANHETLTMGFEIQKGSIDEMGIVYNDDALVINGSGYYEIELDIEFNLGKLQGTTDAAAGDYLLVQASLTGDNGSNFVRLRSINSFYPLRTPLDLGLEGTQTVVDGADESSFYDYWYPGYSYSGRSIRHLSDESNTLYIELTAKFGNNSNYALFPGQGVHAVLTITKIGENDE